MLTKVDWTPCANKDIINMFGCAAAFPREIPRHCLRIFGVIADKQYREHDVLTRGAAVLFISLTLSASLVAESIEGSVVIRKRLTKRRVTAAVPIYERGPAVELDADSEADPIAFERSRVAIYVEGQITKAPADQPSGGDGAAEQAVLAGSAGDPGGFEGIVSEP